MKFKIKNRFTGSLIFSLETSSMKLCVEACHYEGRTFMWPTPEQNIWLEEHCFKGHDNA